MNLRRFLTYTLLAPALLAVAAGFLTLPRPGNVRAQPEPTMVITPDSGPCDATVEITGQDFPPSTAIRLDIGAPDGDGAMGKLASVITDSSGRFALAVSLGSLGCDAARLSQLGQLSILADLEERTIAPGQGVQPILTRAPYAYTTKLMGETAPTLEISPSSGPCDATVEIAGQDFPPNTVIRLDMGVPKGDGTMGLLELTTTDGAGRFTVVVTLGSLGCAAAQLDDGFSGVIGIHADLKERKVVPGEGMPPILTRASYTYTTTQVTAQAQPTTLPRTGDGPASSYPLGWELLLVGLLAVCGVLLTAVSLSFQRRRSGG